LSAAALMVVSQFLSMGIPRSAVASPLPLALGQLPHWTNSHAVGTSAFILGIRDRQPVRV
jgi:hypothetical protein